MVVDIIWAESAQGAEITSDLSWGNISNGSSSDDQLYIRHNGTAKITACEFYIQAYTGSYTGGASASDDYTELIAWGDGDDAEGFLIDQNTENGAEDFQTHKTSQGTSTTAFSLSRNTIIGAGGAGTEGEIEGSVVGAEEAHIQARIAVPAAEDTAGTRQFDQCLSYTYTS
jgi:hypothetical protein